MPELLKGGDRHESLRYGARIELGLRSFLEAGGFSAFTTSFEDLGALRQLPGLAVQRLMADGYGFGAEGDWKTAVLVRVASVDGRRAPRRCVASWRTTPTTSRSGDETILGAHMLEVSPVAHHREADASRSTRSASAARRTRCGSSSTPTPGPAVVVALSDMRDRFRLVANVVENVAPKAPCPSCRSAAPCGSRMPDFATSATAWLTAGAAHHTVMTTAVGVEVFRDFADIARIELLVIDEDTTLREFQQRGPLEPGLLPARPGNLNFHHCQRCQPQ